MSNGDPVIIGELHTASKETVISGSGEGITLDVVSHGGGTGIAGGGDIGVRGYGGGVGVGGLSVLAVPGVGAKGDSGEKIGVWGESILGTGVHGTSKSSFGIRGTSSAGIGVKGESDSREGVSGTSAGGVGVKGESGYAEGVSGYCSSGARPGVYGFTFEPGSVGVEGESLGGSGVRGWSGFYAGVVGVVGSPKRFYGAWLGPPGVLGRSQHVGCAGVSERVGVDGFSPSLEGIAIQGRSPKGWAGYFQGDVFIEGNLTKTGIGSSVAVPFPDGSLRRLYAIESPESWFEDFGDGRLVKGKAEVKIDPGFTKAVTLSKGYHVFLTPHTTKIQGLAVVARRADRFRVEDQAGGSGTFSYRIVARRRDSKARRLERVKVPPSISASSRAPRERSTGRLAEQKRPSESSRRSPRRRSRIARIPRRRSP
jgi:hypothetical protein